MEVKLVPCILLLHLLILLGPCNGIGSKEAGVEILSQRGEEHDHNAHADIHTEQVHSHSSSHMNMMHNIDPSLVVFFFLEDLKPGNTMPIYFPRRENSLPHLLSKEEADSIPFTSNQLQNLLRLFSFSQGSRQAIAMEDTLEECESKPINGETKFCATSHESLLGFIQMIFGSEIRTQSLSTTHLTQSNALVQKYTIMGIHKIPAPKMVACHTMPYPYVVFYCHYQESESRVYRVSLTGENGDKVEAIAVCHMDTSQWGRNHVSFQVLGIQPGSSPVCHFFPGDNFVWVPSTTLMQE